MNRYSYSSLVGVLAAAMGASLIACGEESSSDAESGTVGPGGTGGAGTGGGEGGAGGGGEGGAGGSGGAALCVPGSTVSCYSGPMGTEGVGLCAAGMKTCDESGTAYGPCVAEVVPAVEGCVSDADEDCDGKPSCPGYDLWSKSFGGEANQYDSGGVAIDAAGNIILSGNFSGSVDFGGGPHTAAGEFNVDIHVAKLDPAGKHIWSKSFGDSAAQGAGSTAVDSAGNILLAGSFVGSVDFGGGVLTSYGSGDIFLVKLDAAGNHIWSRQFGSPSSENAKSVATDAAGNVVLAGTIHGGSADFGGGALASAGGNDAFVAKFDPQGGHLWSELFGGPDDEDAACIAIDSAGSIVVTGGHTGSVDFGGGALPDMGDYDTYLLKLDASGAHVFSKGFTTSPTKLTVGNSVAVDGADNILLTGVFDSTMDFGGGPHTSYTAIDDIFIAKLDAAGNHIWSKAFGALGYFNTSSTITADAGGNVLVGGRGGPIDYGGGALPPGGYILKFDPAGGHLWSKGFGPIAFIANRGVAVDEAGFLVLGGTYSSDYPLDFGSGPLQSTGPSMNIVAAKLGL